jgi:hypothetical protein
MGGLMSRFYHGRALDIKMQRLGLGTALTVMAFIAWASMGGQVGAAPQNSSAPALDLSSDIEGPGYEVTLTLNLRVPEGVAISKAVSEITYPGNLLSFVEAMRGLSAEAAGAEVMAEAEDPGGETAILRVTIAAKEGDSIPSGILADLRFKISEEAPADETKVPLKNKVFAWSDQVPPTPIESITGEDGEVTISATPPVFACFFYMH